MAARNAGRRNPDRYLMIALTSLPLRNAARHRRWIAAGHGRACTTATRSADLVLSVWMDSPKHFPRNAHQRQCLILHLVQSPCAQRQIRSRAALKSP